MGLRKFLYSGVVGVCLLLGSAGSSHAQTNAIVESYGNNTPRSVAIEIIRPSYNSIRPDKDADRLNKRLNNFVYDLMISGKAKNYCEAVDEIYTEIKNLGKENTEGGRYVGHIQKLCDKNKGSSVGTKPVPAKNKSPDKIKKESILGHSDGFVY